ncbi:hypothetical protein LPJ54_003264 [Coemansia sp. RSA 1824]|nr:hypothetical protein LPJ54_003264 [Coemansia sp. RSA 1824]KAJ2257629.1 hypothetical protein GGH98_000696 [Coemansia sp. RSA 454]
MKFAAAFALAAVASAQVNTLEEISAKWDQIVSVINGDLPTLKAANPAIYAQATAVIGGTEITQEYNEELIQQVATGIDPALMNAVLSRAGVSGVTLDGEAIPTDDVEEENSESEEASSEEATSEEASSEEATSDSEESEESESKSVSESDKESEESEDKDSSESEDKESDKDSDKESSDEDSESSGASFAKLGVAAVAVAAAFF